MKLIKKKAFIDNYDETTGNVVSTQVLHFKQCH